MTERIDPMVRYFRQLSIGLEALGPAEAAEIVAEVRGHLAKAIAEAGGDDALALARFGTPEVLAARILQERGVLAGGSSLPEAPAWKRSAALLVDVALWLFLLGLFLVPLLVTSWFDQSPGIYWRIFGSFYLAAVLAASVWWWSRARNKRGHLTTGMYVTDLRRVQVGDNARVVRNHDIPGASRRGLARVAWAIRAALILLFVGYLAYGAVSTTWFRDRDETERVHQQAIQNAVRDMSWVTSDVSEVYRMVIADTEANSLSYYFTPEARNIIADLKAKRSAGKLDSYSIWHVELPDYPTGVSDMSATYELTALVQVAEYAQGSNRPAIYEYRVKLKILAFWGDEDGGSWTSALFIESARLAEP